MATSLRVLLVEDSEDDARLVLRQLRGGGYEPEWTRVETSEAMAAALAGQTWDIIICDYSLPRFDALAALELAQAHDRDLPFIVVSGKIGEETAVAIMKAGAHDYVMKDRLQRLPAVVERELREARIRREQRKTETELRQRTHNLQFLQEYSTHLNAMAEHETIEAHAVAAVRKYAGASAVVLSKYLPETRTLEMRHTAADPRFLQVAASILGTAVVGRRTQVPVEMYRRILESRVTVLADAHEASFGAIPKDVATALHEVLGMGGLVAMPLAYQGQLWGTMMCILPAGAAVPDTHTLETVAAMTGQAIARRETQERLRLKDAAITHSTNPIVITDPDGRLRYVNRAWENLHGYQAAEVLGRTAVELWPEEAAWFSQALGAGEGMVCERALRRKDGSTFFVQVSASLVLDEGNQLAGVLVSEVDISERKRAEEMLARSEARYRDLVTNLEDVVFSIDAAGQITYMSPAIERVYGFRPDEMVGHSYAEFVHPEDLPGVAGSFARTLAGDVTPFEYRAYDKHRRLRHLRSTSRVRRENGRPAGLDGVIVDFTELRQAQAARSESEVRFRTAFMTGSDGNVIIKRADGRILEANDRFLEMHGYTRDEVLGRTSLELGMWGKPEQRQEVLSALEQSGRVRDMDILAVRKGGETFPVLYSITPLHLAGQPPLYLGAIRDVTEAKRNQGKLQQQLRFETLMAMLAARFLDVSDDELDAAINDAQQSICDCFGMDRSSIWQPRDTGPQDLALTHAFLGRPGAPARVGTVAKDLFPWTLEQLRSTRKTLAIVNVAQLPTEADRDRVSYTSLGVRSTVTIPWCAADGTLNGVINFSSMGETVTSSAVIGQLETLAQMILVVLDRARERRAMAAGRERMRLLIEMLDEAPVGILIHDVAGAPIYANQHALALHGYGPAEMASLCLANLVAPDRRDDVPGRIRRIIEQGEAAFTTWHVRKDGTPVHLEVRARRTEWERQAVVLAVHTDLTERERAATALLESQERYRLLAENVSDVIWLLDPERGRFEYVSPSVTRLRGYTPEEVMTQPIEAALTPTSLAEARAWLADRRDVAAATGAEDGGVRTSLYNQPCKDGSVVPTEAITRIVRDPATGRPLILGVSRDVTERLKAEKARRELQEQLAQAQKMEAVGQLAGGVAHDFNNLLSVILSYAGFAVDAVREGDPLRADLEEIRKAGTRAAGVVRQLLAFSRKQFLAPEVIDANMVIGSIEMMLRRLLREDIEFGVELAEGLGSVRADPGQLEQVIMNLVVNARDAMPNGGRLIVETRNVDLDEEPARRPPGMRPGSFVMLSVSDTGCGMDEATLARIFEPFFTTKEVGKGTGLGLSTVYGIVKQSEGEIAVDSTPGQGTTFRVYLPRVKAAMTAALPKSTPVLVAGSETVLLVEDEEAVRKIAERTLRSAGYKVLSAASGGDALLLFEKHGGQIDLLLADVVMPHMNGRELAERLAPKAPGLKVVFMSGYISDATARQIVPAAGTGFLGKPFVPAELARKVREVLDGAAVVLEAEPEPAPAAVDSSGDALVTLPTEVLARLREAVVAARVDDMVAIAEEIRSTQPSLAARLGQLLESFDYAGIRALLGE